MGAKHRLLMIGAGGMAGNWIRNFLPPFFDRLEVVGLVDVSPKALQASGDFLNLPAHRRFAEIAAAVDAVDADCCAIVIPPAYHKDAVLQAVRGGLSIEEVPPERPTWEGHQAMLAAGIG
jgi:predicted dehydrogenase